MDRRYPHCVEATRRPMRRLPADGGRLGRPSRTSLSSALIALPFRRALFVGLLGCIAVVVLLRSESADVSTGSAARAVASSHRPRAPANLTPRTRAELTRELKISQIERNGELGVHVQPLEGGAPYRYGPLQSGRTWSVIKVPLVVAFLRWRAAATGVRNGSRVLTPYERGEIEQTIRNSDNRAARHLYNLMAQRFGLDGADGRIEEVFDAAGETGITIPMTGLHAFVTTVWRLSGAVTLFLALYDVVLATPLYRRYMLGCMSSFS